MIIIIFQKIVREILKNFYILKEVTNIIKKNNKMKYEVFEKPLKKK